MHNQNTCKSCAVASGKRLSRRQFMKLVCTGLALGGAGSLLSACGAATPVPEAPPTTDRPEAPSYPLAGGESAEELQATHTARKPSDTGAVQITGVGEFTFEAEQIETVRPDIFQPGHFSLFDILVHLDERGELGLDYHFDQEMDTHVIDAIDDEPGWWYEAHYASGWYEPNVFRMDQYPYKDNSRIRLFPEKEKRLSTIYRTFREEVQRLADNDGDVIIPEFTIRSPSGNQSFQNVLVTAHDSRQDVLQPGVVTALDALLSLWEQGALSNLKLTWYARIAGADPVDSYWVERIDESTAIGGCGFVYETGPQTFAGFSGTHIHIPSDVRVTLSPEYALWFWICLGRGA